MWYKETNKYFCNIKNVCNGENNEQSFRIPSLDTMFDILQMTFFNESSWQNVFVISFNKICSEWHQVNIDLVMLADQHWANILTNGD